MWHQTPPRLSPPNTDNLIAILEKMKSEVEDEIDSHNQLLIQLQKKLNKLKHGGT